MIVESRLQMVLSCDSTDHFNMRPVFKCHLKTRCRFYHFYLVQLFRWSLYLLRLYTFWARTTCLVCKKSVSPEMWVKCIMIDIVGWRFYHEIHCRSKYCTSLVFKLSICVLNSFEWSFTILFLVQFSNGPIIKQPVFLQKKNIFMTLHIEWSRVVTICKPDRK